MSVWAFGLGWADLVVYTAGFFSICYLVREWRKP